MRRGVTRQDSCEILDAAFLFPNSFSITQTSTGEETNLLLEYIISWRCCSWIKPILQYNTYWSIWFFFLFLSLYVLYQMSFSSPLRGKHVWGGQAYLLNLYTTVTGLHCHVTCWHMHFLLGLSSVMAASSLPSMCVFGLARIPESLVMEHINLALFVQPWANNISHEHVNLALFVQRTS